MQARIAERRMFMLAYDPDNAFSWILIWPLSMQTLQGCSNLQVILRAPAWAAKDYNWLIR
jgi:hypothetical protein